MRIRCDYCGKIFERRLSSVKNNRHHFCCIDHYKKYRKEVQDYRDWSTIRRLRTLGKIRNDKIRIG